MFFLEMYVPRYVCSVPGILMIINGQSCEVSIHIKGLSRAVASVVSITITYFKY